MSSILLFGVTGLVGSHLVLALRDNYSKFPVTVYLRNTSIDEYLTKTAGVARVVHGMFDEHEKIAKLAEEHEIVINVGSSWDVGLTEAIVAGLKKRPIDSKTILIHMSGAGNFVDKRWNDGSHHAESKIWNDDSIEDMKAINLTMLNGGPDTLVLTLNKTHPHIPTYLVFPSAIFGSSAGPVRALGVVQFFVWEKAKELGFVPYIGDGTAIANQLHVNAITPFILKLLDLSLQPDAPQGSPYERTYALGGTEIPWKDVSDVFAKAFHAKDITDSPEPKSVTLENAGEGEIPMLMSHDMRFVGPRAERLGYKYEEPDLLEWVRNGGDVIPL